MNSSAQNVVFVINSLCAGGAERVLVNLIDRMEDRLKGFSTHLVLLDVEEERHLAPRFVKKHVLDARFHSVKSAYLLTRLLNQLSPLVTLSFLNRANVATVISSRLLKHPCIISERGHTSSQFARGASAAINNAIIRFTYPLADQVIAVSNGIREDLVANYGIPRHKVRTIYNPVDVQSIEQQASAAPAVAPDPYILSIGRLVPDKNFRLLIMAYRAADIAEKLVILGEGGERGALEELVAELGLTGRVMLPGYVANPYPIMKAARLFVCSSNTEGFPNALIEAMALGCPIVSTDCDVGPGEILHDLANNRCTEVTTGKWGILVPTNTVHALADAIKLALRPDIRATYVERGKERAGDFSVRASVDQYWSTIAPYLVR